MRSFLSYLALSILFISCNESERLDPSPPDAGKGKIIFQENCASCHHVQKKLVGPPLAGTMNFWKNRQDLYDYIHNPEAYLKTRNNKPGSANGQGFCTPAYIAPCDGMG